MIKKIEKKIVGYEVVNLDEQRKKAAQDEKNQIVGMHENVERPEMRPRTKKTRSWACMRMWNARRCWWGPPTK